MAGKTAGLTYRDHYSFYDHYTWVDGTVSSGWVRNEKLYNVDFHAFFGDLAADYNGDDFNLSLEFGFGDFWVIGNSSLTGSKSSFGGLNDLNFESYVVATVFGNSSIEGSINQRLFGEITLATSGTAFMISESAGLILRGLSQSDVAFKTLNGIKGGTKLLGRFAGGADVALNFYLYSQDPSWGNLAKLGVSATGTGLTFSGNPLTVTIGLGITALDLYGTFNALYNNLNSAQDLYQKSGLIFLPSLGPISPYPRVKNLNNGLFILFDICQAKNQTRRKPVIKCA